jgi:hypothetical protein
MSLKEEGGLSVSADDRDKIKNVRLGGAWRGVTK